MSADLSKLPTTTAATLHELLDDVVRAIEAEPRRLDMSDWVEFDPEMDEPPACGTVACIGGWMTILAYGYKDIAARKYSVYDKAYSMMNRAGIDNDRAYDLFDGQVRNHITGDHIGVKSPAYVPAVVDRIRKFQDRFREELQTPLATVITKE
jgi:hypothetical protein